MTAAAAHEAGGGSLCAGIERWVLIAEHATRRSRARGIRCAGFARRAPIARGATHRSRASKGATAAETRKDPFRHPFRPLLPNIARVRVCHSKQVRERCVFGNERNLLAKSYERRVRKTSLNVDPAAPPHALARFLAAAAGNPSQTTDNEMRRPPNAKRGRTRRSSLS